MKREYARIYANMGEWNGVSCPRPRFALIRPNSPALLTAVPVALNVATALLMYRLFIRSGLAPVYSLMATLPMASRA